MSSQASLFFRLGNLVGMGQVDIDLDDSSPFGGPSHRPGSHSILVDAYGGMRILKYVQSKETATAATKGMMMSRPAVTSATLLTPFATVVQTTSGLTAGAHNGKLVYLKANTGGAGTDGEVSVCTTNTGTTIVNLDAAYPWSAAPTTSDTIQLVSTYHAAISGTSDLAIRVQGAVVGQNGISFGNYGWVQQEGPCVVNCTTTALIVNVAVETSATAGSVATNTTLKTIIGDTMSATTTNSVKALVYLKCFTGSANI
jgi:hypothetical protein